MINRQMIEKDYVLYLIDYFGSMQTWKQEDVLAAIARKVKKAKPVSQSPADQWIPCGYAIPAAPATEDTFRDIMIRRKTGDVVIGWNNPVEDTWMMHTAIYGEGERITDAVEWRYPEPYKGGVNMSMIGEQVAGLREKALIFENSGCATDGIVKTFREAADTIEELSAKLAIANMERSTAYYDDGWIPCSEPPKEDGKYLVTIHGTCSIATDTLYFNVDRQEWCEHDDFGFKHTYCNITAWMPLPEPYKGVE